jgi:hypothetical protein
VEPPPHAGVDAPAHPPLDAGVQPPLHAPVDAPVDAGVHTSPHSPLDAAPHTGVDAPPQSPPHAPVDAPVESGASRKPGTVPLWTVPGFRRVTPLRFAWVSPLSCLPSASEGCHLCAFLSPLRFEGEAHLCSVVYSIITFSVARYSPASGNMGTLPMFSGIIAVPPRLCFRQGTDCQAHRCFLSPPEARRKVSTLSASS